MLSLSKKNILSSKFIRGSPNTFDGIYCLVREKLSFRTKILRLLKWPCKLSLLTMNGQCLSSSALIYQGLDARAKVLMCIFLQPTPKKTSSSPYRFSFNASW